ncbi:MAG: hypothetical protein HC925_06470 [Coleofasciculaceae cyanobacterium SM2_3_26]|nr:hypothetical protein [Coleofasciculaceae cyanobacterium SM2_3_26]
MTTAEFIAIIAIGVGVWIFCNAVPTNLNNLLPIIILVAAAWILYSVLAVTTAEFIAIVAVGIGVWIFYNDVNK